MALPYIVTHAVLATLCVQALAQNNPYQLSGNDVSLQHNLSLVIDVDTSQYSGQVDILVLIFIGSTNVTVNYAGQNVSLEQIQFKTLFGRSIRVLNVSSDTEHEQMTIQLGEGLKDGFLYICSVRFISQLGTRPDHGLYRYSYVDTTGVTRSVALADFQYTKARRVFPCYDEPQLKTNFLITVTHSSQYTALSNAPVQSVVPHDSREGWVVTTFQETESLSTYKLGLVVAEMDEIGIKAGSTKFPLRVLTQPKEQSNASFTLQTAGKVIRQIEDLCLYEYPLDKLDIAASYDTSDETAIHSWALIVLRDEVILEDAHTGRVDRCEHVWILTRALVDQWIGSLVTSLWWTDLWAFEGLRTEFAGIVLDRVFPDWNLHNYKRAENLNVVFKYDSLTSSQNISTSLQDPRDIDEVFGETPASKGFLLYHTISRLMGAELFGKAMDFYMQEKNFGAADSEDFYTYVMKLTRHQNKLPDSVKLKEIMDTWSLQPGYPVLTIQRDTGTVTVTQRRFLLSGDASEGKECWWLPVTHATAKSPNFNQSITGDSWWDGCNQTQLVLQTDATADDWIIIINQASVICHVNYDAHTWSLLVTLLTTGDVTRLDEMNCYQLVRDVFALAHAGDVEYSLAFQILKYLKRELRLVPWLAGTQVLANLRTLIWRSALYSEFQGFVRRLVGDVYTTRSALSGARVSAFVEDWRYSVTLTQGFVRRLVGDVYTARSALSGATVSASVEEWRYSVTLTQVACDAQLSACVTSAVQAFTQWMSSDSTTNLLDPDVRRLVYREGVRQGTKTEFDFVWNKYLTSSSDKEQRIFLDALACTTQQDLLDQLLANILDTSSGLKTQHAFTTFSFVAQNSPLGFNRAVTFLTPNLQKIHDLKGTVINYVSQLSEGMVYSSEIEQMKTLVTSHPELFLHSTASVNRSLDVADTNLKWINKYTVNISTLLQT